MEDAQEKEHGNAEKISHRIWMLIMKLYNENSKIFTANLKSVGLNPTQFEVLYFIREHEPIDQKTIAAHLNVTQGNITQCMYKLKDLKLIDYRKDWKTKYISLTDRGHALMCELIPQQQAQMEASLQGLTVAERKQLHRLLEQFACTCKYNE